MTQDISVQAIRNYVRSFIDVDNTDIPDSLCDSWIYTGWDDLIGSTVKWPFYEVGENAAGTVGSTNPGTLYQITTVVGQQNYPMPAVTVQGISASVDVHNIVAIQGPHWEMLWEAQGPIESSFVPAFTVSQEPERYSFWGSDNLLTCWPIPNSAFTLNVRAYRNPVDWVSLGAGGVIDAPTDFFSVLQNYVLAQGWGQQTDLSQASFWMQQYEAGKARLVRKYLKAPLTSNIVLNGGQGTRDLPPRLRYPFEGANAIGIGR